MPDFTVINGGGGRGKDSDAGLRAKSLFRDLMIELLRDLARDRGEPWRIVQALFDFWDAAGDSDAPIIELIGPAMDRMRDDLFWRDYQEAEEEEVFRHALRVMAETMCHDPAAKGRASQRHMRFQAAVEILMLEHERRSRENGWSYMDRLARDLAPPKRQQAPPRRPRVRKAPVVAASRRESESNARQPTVDAPEGKPQALSIEKPNPRTPPSYEGLKRYAASRKELEEFGVRTVKELVQMANHLLIEAGLWPLAQGDFPGNRTQFERVAKIIRSLRP